jgi:hypothetical protein
MPLVIEKSLRRRRRSRADAVKRQETRLSEEITGWAVNALFPIPGLTNSYARFPWRRIRKTHSLICGTIFAVRVLLIWPFELAWELIRLPDTTETDDAHRNIG